MSDDLGQFLKMAREERGLSLDDLQEMTKIQKRYIDAIEKGNFHQLPGPFYARAFIRNIAETLNLNTDQLIKQYEEILPVTNKEIVEVIPRSKKRISAPTNIGKWVTTFLLVAFVILIFSIVYYFAVQNFPPEKQTTEQEKPVDVVDKMGSEQPKQEEPAKPTQPEEPQEPEPPQPLLTFVEKKDSTYYYKISNVNSIELKLRAEGGRCWYRVQKGNGKSIIKEGTLEDGMEQTFALEDLSNVYIRLGYTKAMKIEVNGQFIDTSEMPDSSRFDITLDPLPTTP